MLKEDKVVKRVACQARVVALVKKEKTLNALIPIVLLTLTGIFSTTS